MDYFSEECEQGFTLDFDPEYPDVGFIRPWEFGHEDLMELIVEELNLAVESKLIKLDKAFDFEEDTITARSSHDLAIILVYLLNHLDFPKIKAKYLENYNDRH